MPKFSKHVGTNLNGSFSNELVCVEDFQDNRFRRRPSDGGTGAEALLAGAAAEKMQRALLGKGEVAYAFGST